MNNEYIWSEIFRPELVKDCILPNDLKNTFQSFVDSGNVKNLLLWGSSGVGKTTVALAMLKELNAEYYFINASLNGGIDTLRNDIQNFASTVSFFGGRKYVILDEADRLTRDTQEALRGFMQEFSGNVSFILTCNFINKIIDPLQGRCSVIEFKIPTEEREKLAMKFYKRVQTILEKNDIEYEPAAVCEVISKYFPTWRRAIEELQGYSANGKIDSGVLARLRDSSIEVLIEYLKNKDFKEARKWVAEQTIDSSSIFRQFYDEAYDYLKEDSVPQLVLHIGKYQDYASRVADQEINLMSFLTEVMMDCEFK